MADKFVGAIGEDGKFTKKRVPLSKAEQAEHDDKLANHVPRQPRSAPDRDAAIRALIAGDTAAAQTAMGKME